MADKIRLDLLRQVGAECAEISQRAIDEQVQLVEEHLNDAEKAIVAKGNATVAITELREAGIVKNGPSVLDATNRQLQAVAAVWGVIHRWDCSLNLDRRLGDELKVLPPEDVELIVEALHRGDLLTSSKE